MENKDGRGYFKASVVVDATGDADVACRCGIAYEDGVNYLTHIAYYTDLRHSAKVVAQKNMLYARSWRNSGADLWGHGHPAELPVFTGISAQEQTQFVLEGRKRLFQSLEAIPPEQWDIACLPAMAQYRKSRRIIGEYTLTESDCGRSFMDSIGIIGDFANPGSIYELPYRSLYHRSVSNLFVVGRCISSTGWAWDVTRVIPAAAATGEAAGAACAMCIANQCENDQLPVEALQKDLLASSVTIHIP